MNSTDPIELRDGKITAVDWVAVFPSLRLVKCGREALEWRRMAVAFAWVALLWVGAKGLDAALDGGVQSFLEAQARRMPNNPWVWDWVMEWARVMLVRPYEFVLDKPGAAIIALAWLLVSTLAAGACVSRLAGHHAARGEGLPLRDMAAFFRGRWVAIFGAPALVLGALGVLYGVLMLAGLVCFSSSALVGVGAVLFGLLLPVGLLAVLLAAAWTLGTPLMLPAVAVEGNDAFDAPGRAVSYLLARPWTIGLHVIMLSFFAAVFIGLAVLLKECTLAMLASALHHGSIGYVFNNAWSGHDEAEFSATVLGFWRAVAQSLVFAYAFSFLITGFTRIYLLIRESADGVPETDIWMPEDGKKAPEAAA